MKSGPSGMDKGATSLASQKTQSRAE
jgi:hypothetical protein